MKRLAVLGSTGSIGRSCLKVVDANPDAFRVVALAAGQNLNRLEKQVHRYHPALVVVAEREASRELEVGRGSHDQRRARGHDHSEAVGQQAHPVGRAHEAVPPAAIHRLVSSRCRAGYREP